MTTFEQVKQHFGGYEGLKQALGLQSVQAIYMWDGKIPEKRAYQIEIITSGKFTAESIMAAWPKKKKKAKRAH
jgi:hypothetical protein